MARRSRADVPSWQYLGQLKETALVDVAKNFFPGGGILILIGGLFSTMSALNATIYSSSRVSFAMGRDRNLPSWFGSVHPQRKTPHWAILASGLLSVVMAVTLPIEAVASAANIMFLLLFIQVQAALITLRKKRPDLRRGFKVPFVPLIPDRRHHPATGTGGVPVFLQPDGVVERGGLDWPGAGGFLHLFAPARPFLRANGGGARSGGTTRNTGFWPASAIRSGRSIILDAAVAVARQYDAELIVLSVVEVHDRELLAQGFDHAQQVKEVLAQAVADLRNDGIPVRAVVENFASDFLRHHGDGSGGAMQPDCHGPRAPGQIDGAVCRHDCGSCGSFRPGPGDGRQRRTLAGEDRARFFLPTNADRTRN